MNPFKHPVVDQMAPHDLEKEAESKKSTNVNAIANADGETSPATTNSASVDGNLHNFDPTLVLFKGKLVEWNEKVEGLAGLEARGISRVFSEERHGDGPRGQCFSCGSAST